MAGPGPAGVLLAGEEVGTEPPALSCPFCSLEALAQVRTSPCVCGGLSGRTTLLCELHSDAHPLPPQGSAWDSALMD